MIINSTNIENEQSSRILTELTENKKTTVYDAGI